MLHVARSYHARLSEERPVDHRPYLTALCLVSVLTYLHGAGPGGCVVFGDVVVSATWVLWGALLVSLYVPSWGVCGVARDVACVLWGSFLLMALQPSGAYLSLRESGCEGAPSDVRWAAWSLVVSGLVWVLDEVCRRTSDEDAWTSAGWVSAVSVGLVVAVHVVHHVAGV